jgi:large subunit ribosomal protein L10
MDRASKERTVGELKERLAKVSSIVVADYRGLSVPTVTGLRDQFRKVQCDYKIYKNTLVKIAIAGTPIEPLGKYLEGTTALMFSYESPAAAAKVATAFAKTEEKFSVKAAYFDGTVVDAKGVEALARMPGRDELRATLLATLMAPAQNLAATLAAGPTSFMYVLDARSRQLGEGQQQG